MYFTPSNTPRCGRTIKGGSGSLTPRRPKRGLRLRNLSHLHKTNAKTHFRCSFACPSKMLRLYSIQSTFGGPKTPLENVCFSHAAASLTKSKKSRKNDASSPAAGRARVKFPPRLSRAARTRHFFPTPRTTSRLQYVFRSGNVF